MWQMDLRFYVRDGWAVAGLLAGLLLSGCSKPQPYAASTNLALTPEEQRTKQVLTPEEERQAMGILKSVADGAEVVEPPSRAEHGVRWRDVPKAAGAAASETEMVVVRRIDHDWGYEFVLRTVEDYPGTLNVRKTNDERVYQAEATIGLFENRIDRADALLKAFNKSMQAYGRKLQFEHDPLEPAGQSQ